MTIHPAQRLKLLPPYLFAQIDAIKQEELRKGRRLFPLGIGDPDLPTPNFIIERLALAARNPANHQYPSYVGMLSFREAASRWLSRKYGVTAKPQGEILSLIGSKEGLAHLPLALVNPGEGVLVPDPGYPVYSSATLLAGGVPLPFALREENGYLPDFAELEALIKKGPRVRLLFLNYPNNPTAAVANGAFFKEVVAFARKHDVIVCHDNAYSELYFDGNRPPCFLETPGAAEVGCEFFSLSKAYNMTGWRVGFAAGNAAVLDALGKVKTNMDSGIFNAVQEAGIAALDQGDAFCEEMRALYQRRREVLVPALQRMGLRCANPPATFYVWAAIPRSRTSSEFVLDLIRKQGVVATPGSGFGAQGEGYVRFTLCSDESTLKQVAQLLEASV